MDQDPTTAVISGTEGSLEIEGDFYAAGRRVRLRSADRGRSEVESFVVEGTNGFEYQVAEAARCIAAGLQQSPRMTWDSSRAVMAVMDEARRQIGVVYPGE